MARRLLVGHDGSPASNRALAEAAWRARAQHGCVTVVYASPQVPRCAVFSPVSFVALEHQVRTEFERELIRTVESLPTCVSVTRVETRRRLGPALLAVWRRGEHDAVLLAAGGLLSARGSAARLMRRAGVEPILIGSTPGRPSRTRRLRRLRPRGARGRARPA